MEISYLKQYNSNYPLALTQRLSSNAPESISAIGNLDILRNRKIGLFCSVKCPGHLILKAYDLAQALRQDNITVISGFQSPVERDCLNILLRGSQPIIICLARSMENMRLKSEYKKPLSDGCLLLLSPFINKPIRPTTATTIYRNRIVASLADSIVIIHAEPNGRIEQLSHEISAWQKPLYTFESSANDNLIGIGAKSLSIDKLSGYE
ncbi:TPA: hypothetical protein ENS27_03380 [bacterium]|mgnify:CR=1 FL=1|nr:hypothetical protein [bacterium]